MLVEPILDFAGLEPDFEWTAPYQQRRPAARPAFQVLGKL
jgi:hypothetical protein